MSGGPGLTVSISNGRGTVLRTVSNADAPPATPPKPDSSAQTRAQTRAQLAAVYAGVLGLDVPAQDMVDALRMQEGDAPSLSAIATGLEGAGLLTSLVQAAGADAAPWPGLAQMSSGQVLLVLGREGDDLVIYDPTCRDNRAEVPLAEFTPFFTGQALFAEKPLSQLDSGVAPLGAHWFWGRFAAFRRQFAEIMLGSLVANLLAVSVALFSLQVYDRVIPHQSEATLWVLALGAGVALVMEALLKMARARLMDGAGRQIETGVQALLMERILGMRSELAGRGPGRLFAAMREFGSVREFFTASTIGSLADLPFVVVFLALVASIAGPVVWLLMAGGVLMVLPGFLMQRRMIRLTQEMQGASVQSSRLLHEAIFELDTVKTQRGEDRIRRLWAELNALSSEKSGAQRQLAARLTFWSQAVQQGTYVAAVIMGTYLVFAGAFTVGSIIAVGILTGRTLAPLTQLAGTMARWGNVKSALDGLDAIACAAQDTEDGRSYLRREHLKGAYELRELQFGYEGDGAPVLDVPGLSIAAGQKLAVLGTNGSGKSSLLKVLAGLYAPTRGRLMLDGTEMSQIAPRDLRRNIGYLGQDVRLFAGTLRDNLNLTLLERDDARLMAALDFAGLGPFVRGHAKGLDLEILDGGQGLSQGQRQSIGWARLWLQDPAICLLDEPTAALDQTLEATLISRLEGWLEGRTALIATHRMPILRLTSRTIILQSGRLAVDGPRDKVLAHLEQAGAR